MYLGHWLACWLFHVASLSVESLHCWRHNDRDGVSNHQPHDCLLNCLFRRRSRKHQSSTSHKLLTKNQHAKYLYNSLINFRVYKKAKKNRADFLHVPYTCNHMLTFVNVSEGNFPQILYQYHQVKTNHLHKTRRKYRCTMKQNKTWFSICQSSWCQLWNKSEKDLGPVLLT